MDALIASVNRNMQSHAAHTWPCGQPSRRFSAVQAASRLLLFALSTVSHPITSTARQVRTLFLLLQSSLAQSPEPTASSAPRHLLSMYLRVRHHAREWLHELRHPQQPSCGQNLRFEIDDKF
jgi:hypothetical protein